MFTTFAMLLGFGLSTAVQTAALSDTDEVDVELVLAVDVSRSMDFEELEVQRSGYVEALRHPDFINAVRTGLIGRIAIAYYEWSGEVVPQTIVDWHIIETTEDADAFAAKVATVPVNRFRGTSISGAIAFGGDFFERNSIQGMRQVIDVSGDGPNNRGLPVVPVRDEVLAAGIVINGLAIMLRPSASIVPLDQYYADCVVGGPGSFVLPVHKTSDFAAAIRRKLVMEISSLAPPRIMPAADQPAADCMIGEKLRYDYRDP